MNNAALIGSTLSIDTLYHIVATKDNAGNKQFILNGKPESSDSSAETYNSAVATDFLIGGQSVDCPISATIDEVAVYNSALTIGDAGQGDISCPTFFDRVLTGAEIRKLWKAGT